MTRKRSKVPWYATQFPFQNFLFQYMPWTSIYWGRKYYGYSWLWLIKAWITAKPGKDRLFGGVQDKTGNFFEKLAHRSHEEATLYACVYGTCTVIWHPTRGNMGGGGRPGCPCDDMEDPRDLNRGPLK